MKIGKTKNEDNGNNIIISIIIFVLINVIASPFLIYWFNSIEYEFNAKVEQCHSMLDNYNDKLPDLINLERTYTDRSSIDNSYYLRECRKIINNPDFFIIGKYLLFIFSMILFEILIILISVLYYSLTKEDNNKNKYDDDEHYY
jgi:predicted PurR-regulated permease PerM